ADRLGAALDVAWRGAGQPADDALGDDLGDLADRLEVAVRGDREAGLDDIDPHLLEDLGQLQLLVQRHRRARRLLAVTHGGVEYDDAVGLGYEGTHGVKSFVAGGFGGRSVRPLSDPPRRTRS